MVFRAAIRTAFLSLALLGAACHRVSDGKESQESANAALAELGDTPDFSLVDQAGKTVTKARFSGKVWAAAFMFTRCPTICPEITRRMKKVQERAAEQRVPLELVSFSVDPDNDTPEVLKKYASDYDADTKSWSFLTGSYDAIARTAEQGFKVGVEKNPADKAGGGITHGAYLVLVDQRGKIRGYYRTSEDAALERLLADAKRLGQ